MRRLLRNSANGAVVDYTPTIASQEGFVELTPAEVSEYLLSVQAPVVAVGSGIGVWTSGRGIGDAISALYACCGYARAGHRVEFRTHLSDLFTDFVSEENLTIGDGSRRGAVDCNRDYPGHLKAARDRGVSRALWYSESIGLAYGIDVAPPVRPRYVVRIAPPDDPYILLAPFAAHRCREWGEANFARLAVELRSAGRKVEVVGAESDRERAREVFGSLGFESQHGLSMPGLVRLVGGASLVIANESGIAHLAGLLEVPAIVPLGPTKHEWTYDMAPTVTSISPPPGVKCQGCYWQREGGLLPVCSKECSALRTIHVFQVAERAIGVLTGKRATLRLKSPRARETS